jgi:hypothetical protein
LACPSLEAYVDPHCSALAPLLTIGRSRRCPGHGVL